MAVIEIAKIQVRRGQELQTGIPRLDPGEFGWAEDTEHLYIGKRISEGAVDDENSRILTERDLDNIFELVGNTVTQVVAYKYREDVAYVRPDDPITLQDKLDETVSVISYGIVPSFTPVDITTDFQVAIDKIFKNSSWDSYERTDSRRALIIPAGHYYVSSPIELPPYAVLKGEGPELTKLTYIGESGSMFKTIDAEENDFESGIMDDGVKRAREVSLSGMTLEFTATNSATDSLISIDNVLNATVRNVTFRTAIDTTATKFFGLTDYGVGVSIRGTGNGLGSGDTNLCENIQIVDCIFDSLQLGVIATGTVVRPVIENSIFSHLQNGVVLTTGTIFASIGPTNGLITKNRFENIVKEGILVGPNPDERASNVISSENSFFQVGNGPDLDDFTIEEQYPVIRFTSQGNKSIDDSFSRKTQADTTNDPTFYYNELVKGNAAVNNAAVFTATLAGGTITGVSKIALPDRSLKSVLNYKIENYGLSRTGQVLVTTDWAGESSLVDSYDFIEGYHLGVGGLTPLAGSGLQSDAGFVAMSGSPVAISAGVQTFTVNTVGDYAVSTRVRFSDSVDPANYMEGYIQSVDTGTLTITAFIDSTGGIGTYASWNISPIGDVLIVEANTASSFLTSLIGYAPATPPDWYLTGDDQYASSIATVLRVDEYGGNYSITTDSADAFDFKTFNTETCAVVKNEESVFTFSVNNANVNKNYVTLTAVNGGSEYTDAVIKYQIDTLS